MVISRPEQDIDKAFRMFNSVDVGKATANQDISKYLELQMESKFKKYNEIIQKKIESRLREHAEGSYGYPYYLIQLWLILCQGSDGLHYSLLSCKDVQANIKLCNSWRTCQRV